MSWASEDVFVSLQLPPPQFIDYLQRPDYQENVVAQTIVASSKELISCENGMDNIGIFLLRSGISSQNMVVSAMLPFLPTLMFDAVGYQVMEACCVVSTFEPLKTPVERLLKESLSTLMTHEIGVYVVRDLCLRGHALVVETLGHQLDTLMNSSLGCELLSWLVDVPVVGSFVSQNWETMIKQPHPLRVVLAALRVRSHLQVIFNSILPYFNQQCEIPEYRQVIEEMIPLLDIPTMQTLCDKLMTFPGRGKSHLLDMLSQESTFHTAFQVLEASEGVTRVLLVDHLRTYAFYLQGTSREAEVTTWAKENPSYHEVIVVYDKATSQFYTMDITYTTNTFNRREWLRLKGKVDHLASVCINFQNDTCRAHERCNMIHVDRDVIKSLRPHSCCAEHGHEASKALLQDEKMYSVVLPDQSEMEFPACKFAITAGWEQLKTTKILESGICRQHQREACGKPSMCKFIHICRQSWNEIVAAHPPIQNNNVNLIGAGNGCVVKTQSPHQMQMPLPNALPTLPLPPPPMLVLPAAPPPSYFVPFAPFPTVFVQPNQAMGDENGNLHMYAMADHHTMHMSMQMPMEAQTGTLVPRKKYIHGGA